MKQTKKRKQLVLGKKWTPKQIPTVMWFDAADSSKIKLDGSTVSKWRNKSRCRILYFLSQLIEKVKTWVHYLLKP
ncbi:MAG: hypothetical protein ACKPEQ_25680 [Dolichospermum sp.]